MTIVFSPLGSFSFYCFNQHSDQKQLMCNRPSLRDVNTGNQGRYPEVGMVAETMEDCCLLDDPHSPFSSLSYTTQGHPPRVSPTHSRLGPLTVIVNQPRKCSTDLPTGHSREAIFLHSSFLFPDESTLGQTTTAGLTGTPLDVGRGHLTPTPVALDCSLHQKVMPGYRV